MEKQDVSVTMLQANIYSLAIAVPLVVGMGFIYSLRWGIISLLRGVDGLLGNFLIFLTVFLGGIVVHELIHGLTWMLFGRKPFSAVRFGFQLKTLTPYAHVREPLPVNAYRLGAFAPGAVLGILPFLVAVITGSGWLLAFGLLFTFAAGGDFLILWLLRNVARDRWVEDHPTNAGCYVLPPLTNAR
jgi:hypothetical protein